MKKKNIWIKALALVLMAVGIFLLLTPWVKTKKLQADVNKNIKVAEEIKPEEIEANEKEEVPFRYEEVNDVTLSDVLTAKIEATSRYVVGILYIPDLDINLPILKGTTRDNLMAGVCTMRPNQKMGVGNYPLAGHIMPDKKLLFGSLMDIKKGADVYITDKKYIYHYKIFATEVVSDRSIYMIEDQESKKRQKPIISLMTCYYSSKTGKRFFAVGDLVNKTLLKDNRGEPSKYTFD